MKVSELYAPNGPFVGKDLWIVGTGPSMSVFPLDYLQGKTCLLLNDAQRWFPGIGPIAMANSLKFLKGCELPFQLVKGRLKFEPNPERTDNHCPWDSPDYYVYSYREPPWDEASHNDERTLFSEPDFYWSPKQGSISAFAMQFALWAGVRSIQLVGCDCCALNGMDYAVQKPPRKRTVRHVYPQYMVGILRMMQECKRRGVPVVQVNPFAGIGDEAKQLEELQG